MAARILSRLNLVSKRFFTNEASVQSPLVQKELAESKHAACKSEDWVSSCNFLYEVVRKVVTLNIGYAITNFKLWVTMIQPFLHI